MADVASSDGVVTVELAGHSKSLDELEAVTVAVRSKEKCDVVLNFGNVEVVNSAGIMRLLDLRDVVTKRKNRLVLSGVSDLTKSIFVATGLDGIFEFFEGKVGV